MSSDPTASAPEDPDPAHRPERGGWPRITVVTPSYQQGRFLEATMDSVLDQGYPNLEYIVVDGGSTDGSLSLLHRYEERLAWWISEPDRGQAHAINKGFARGTGEILGWLNSDDLLLPGSLHRIANAFRRRPSTSAVAGLRRRIDVEGHAHGSWIRDLPTKAHLRHYCCLAQETVYWRRSVWEKLGPLDETLHYALDYEYWLRMVHNGFAFTWLPHYLGALREHPETKTALLKAVRRSDLKEVYRRYGLGRNEEEVLGGQGEYWPHRLALLDDLGRSAGARSPRFVSFILRQLANPRGRNLLTIPYRHFRVLRPLGEKSRSRMTAMAKAVWRTLVRRPVGDRKDPYLLRSDPLSRSRLDQGEWSQDLESLGPPDTIRVGAGWHWVEHSPEHVYRWAENDAEIVVLRPSGRLSKLLIDLETGPALDWQPFDLTVLDEEDAVLLTKRIESRETLALSLPLEAGPDARIFRLRVAAHGGPASPTDWRILRFRATRIRWAEEDDRHDLPLALGQAAEIVLDPGDIVPTAPVEALLDGSASDPADLRTPGLFLGRGWLRRDKETGCRSAVSGAELLISNGGGRELIVELNGASPHGTAAPNQWLLESNLHDRIEGRSGGKDKAVHFVLPESLPANHLLRLTFAPEIELSPPVASLRLD